MDQRVSFGLDGLAALIGALGDDGSEGGRRLLAPRRVPHGADIDVVWDEIDGVDALPIGWHDETEPGRRRLVDDGTATVFGVSLATGSPKAIVHPPEAPVWTLHRTEGEVAVHLAGTDVIPTALLGVRPCEAAAIARLDTVLLGGPHPDRAYRARRDDLLVVVVECTRSTDTCFCASAGTGPAHDVDAGAAAVADLVLTEIDVDGVDGPRFLAKATSDRGRVLLDAVDHVPATGAEAHAATRAVHDAGHLQRRALPPDVAARLLGDLGDDHWQAVAERCVACANCTLVCPTCFCSDLIDTTDLAGEFAERRRTWDSCFRLDFSHMGSGPIRDGRDRRYRQWLTHKLSTWHEQFGESGCVGCGRCITWCPVGIDLTAEAAEVIS